MKMIRVRIRATGQVLDMAPAPARAMILGRTAEEVNPVESASVESPSAESMAVAPSAERAVTPAQAGPSKKQIFSRRKAG